NRAARAKRSGPASCPDDGQGAHGRSRSPRPASWSSQAFCRAASRLLPFASDAETETPSSNILKLRFYLSKRFALAVQRHLGDDAAGAGTGKVRALQFDLRTLAGRGLRCRDKMMRRHAGHLRRFLHHSPALFGLLTALELRNVWLGTAEAGALLRACGRLERLALRHCQVSLGVELVVDAPPRSALRELVLEMCFYGQVEVRSAPRLARLTCDMWATAVPARRVALANPAAPASKRFRLSKLLAEATDLRRLSLDFESEKVRHCVIWIRREPPEQLHAALAKLTALSVAGIFPHRDLMWLMFFLEAAPNLREFSVAVQKHFCHGKYYNERRKIRLWWKPSNFRHNHLEKLKIAGFETEDKYFTFVRSAMERATNLKIVILTDEEACGHCDFAHLSSSRVGSMYPRNEDEKDSVVKQLKDGFSSHVQILFLR
ncbi:hypothetical protein BAE44_0007694, partial [Dichanthelium oligosanthes]